MTETKNRVNIGRARAMLAVWAAWDLGSRYKARDSALLPQSPDCVRLAPDGVARTSRGVGGTWAPVMVWVPDGFIYHYIGPTSEDRGNVIAALALERSLDDGDGEDALALIAALARLPL